MRILIVDDEEPIRCLIKFNLERAGYETAMAGSALEALKSSRGGGIDLILLDLMLPDMSGLDVCRALKGDDTTVGIPIIMVSARSEDNDIVKGLEIGADDYITKPFSPKVLVARVKSVLRHRARDAGLKAEGSAIVQCGALSIDKGRHEVHINGTPLEFSATEFDILHFLSLHAGQVFSRRQIIDAIKGDDYPATERSVDVQVLAIRRKIAQAGGLEMIETIRGVGYRMKDYE